MSINYFKSFHADLKQHHPALYWALIRLLDAADDKNIGDEDECHFASSNYLSDDLYFAYIPEKPRNPFLRPLYAYQALINNPQVNIR